MQAPPSYSASVRPASRCCCRCCCRCRPAACLHPERNLVSAVVSVAVMGVVCVAVFQPRWFWLEGGGCSTHTLSLYLFFFSGHSTKMEPADLRVWPASDSVTSYIYHIDGQVLESCLTPHIVSLLQLVIGLVFLMVCAAAVQVMVDLVGPAGKTVRCLRRNALPSIVAVWACVGGVGVCYRLTILLEVLQEATKPSFGSSAADRVQVKFDLGFYLFVLGGGLAVLAVGCSWLRPAHLFQAADTTPLMEDCGLEGLDTLVVDPAGGPAFPCLMDREPPPPLEGNPPPPYTP